MGVRKRMKTRIKGIGSSQGIVGLRRQRLAMPDKFMKTPLLVSHEREAMWTEECDREIARLMAWEGRMR